MIVLHGAAASRASRSLLALEELGLPYRHAPLKPWSDAADAETLARINPNARVPVLDDERHMARFSEDAELKRRAEAERLTTSPLPISTSPPR